MNIITDSHGRTWRGNTEANAEIRTFECALGGKANARMRIIDRHTRIAAIVANQEGDRFCYPVQAQIADDRRRIAPR